MLELESAMECLIHHFALSRPVGSMVKGARSEDGSEIQGAPCRGYALPQRLEVSTQAAAGADRDPKVAQ